MINRIKVISQQWSGVQARRGAFEARRGALIIAVGFIVVCLAGCSSFTSEFQSDDPGDPGSDVMMPADTIEPATRTPTPVTPTATVTHTPRPTQTSTNTATVTNTPTPTETPTETAPPPTPSGDDAIYVYAIQDKVDESGKEKRAKCDFIAVRLNTGAWRTGDTAADVSRALKSLFVKRQWFGSLYNPAYLSNISVDSVEFKPFSGLISIRLSGTYVRSGDRCDDSRVRAQVWSTIRQFPEVKTIYILLNGNLLGDILATGK